MIRRARWGIRWTYVITLSNNSSEDTPDMVCTAVDTLLGTVFDAVLPAGDTVLNLSRVVLAEDCG